MDKRHPEHLLYCVIIPATLSLIGFGVFEAELYLVPILRAITKNLLGNVSAFCCVREYM